MLVAHKANLEVRTAHSGLLVSKARAAWEWFRSVSSSVALKCTTCQMNKSVWPFGILLIVVNLLSCHGEKLLKHLKQIQKSVRSKQM